MVRCTCEHADTGRGKSVCQGEIENGKRVLGVLQTLASPSAYVLSSVQFAASPGESWQCPPRDPPHVAAGRTSSGRRVSLGWRKEVK